MRANDEDRAASGWREIDETARKDALGRAGTGAIDPFGNLIRFCELIDKR